jgi:putative flippase GtrA
MQKQGSHTTQPPGLRPHRSTAFVLVGVLGFLVQLEVLTTGLALDHHVATAAAVEMAVVHNFVWHERWTWSDRAVLDCAGVWRRLGRFQISSGVVSIAGNVIVTALIVACTGVPLLLANVLAVGACTLPNFVAVDRLVFRAACGGQA